MSRLLETLVGWLFDAVALFENMRARRSDDELTAKHRALQRSCTAAGVGTSFVAVLIVVVGGLLDSADSSPLLTNVAERLRAPIGWLLVLLLAASWTYCAYSWWSLLRFRRSLTDD
jgi:hypothetical protein